MKRSSKRSGFRSPCSTTALQVSARLPAKPPALHKGPASGLSVLPLPPASLLRLRHSPTPPTLPACPRDASEECKLHGAQRGTARSPRASSLLHTKVPSISPGPFRASSLPQTLLLLSASFRCAPASTVVPELQAARRGLASCCIQLAGIGKIPQGYPIFSSPSCNLHTHSEQDEELPLLWKKIRNVATQNGGNRRLLIPPQPKEAAKATRS